MSVRAQPGETALTLMPRGESSSAKSSAIHGHDGGEVRKVCWHHQRRPRLRELAEAVACDVEGREAFSERRIGRALRQPARDHDHARAVGEEGRQATREQPGATNVHVPEVAAGALVDAGVVDEDIEALVARGEARDERSDARGGRDVEGERFAVGEAGGVLWAANGEEDARSFGGEELGDAAADASRGAGD